MQTIWRQRPTQERRTGFCAFRPCEAFLGDGDRYWGGADGARRRRRRHEGSTGAVRLSGIGASGMVAGGKRQRAGTAGGGARQWGRGRRSGKRRQRDVTHRLAAVGGTKSLRQLVLEAVQGARSLKVTGRGGAARRGIRNARTRRTARRRVGSGMGRVRRGIEASRGRRSRSTVRRTGHTLLRRKTAVQTLKTTTGCQNRRRVSADSAATATATAATSRRRTVMGYLRSGRRHSRTTAGCQEGSGHWGVHRTDPDVTD